MEILDGVKWYIKADLSAGYRQFGTHPVDWPFQVYCNGRNEHYIDIACPFGKTNSSLEFCPMVTLIAKSMAVRYAQIYGGRKPTLGTHVDDIFGGFKECDDYERACHFRSFMCSVGDVLTVKFNPKPEKTPLPATRQVILGRSYDSTTKRVNTALKKVRKYRLRIASALAVNVVSTKEIEKLHGCLNYVADIEPFGRPFLAHLTMALSEAGEEDTVTLSKLTKLGLKIWDRILCRNKEAHLILY